MRLALILALIATPLQAWEFTPRPVCTLAHDAPDAAIRITYDPALAEPYAIAVTRALPWPEGGGFAIDYDGGTPFTITTNRQRLSDGGRTLSVTDRGFGNVLDGLERNRTATARAGGVALPFDLSGAAPAVQAFRACIAAPVA